MRTIKINSDQVDILVAALDHIRMDELYKAVHGQDTDASEDELMDLFWETRELVNKLCAS